MSMMKVSLSLSLVAVLALSAAAEKPAAPAASKPAAPAATPAPPPMAPPKPSDDTKALAPMAGNYTFIGKLQKDANGPGSPEMATKGSMKCAWVLDSFWLACEVVDIAGTGKGAMTWKGHFVIGYDAGAKGLRSTGYDNMGDSFTQSGHWDGKKLVLESTANTLMMGMPIKFRFTFDLTDPKNVKFTDERSVKGSPFMLAEEGVYKKK